MPLSNNPNIHAVISYENSIYLLLKSVADIEICLSKLIDAESTVLRLLAITEKNSNLKVSDIIIFNKSAQRILKKIFMLQMLLQLKLEYIIKLVNIHTDSVITVGSTIAVDSTVTVDSTVATESINTAESSLTSESSITADTVITEDTAITTDTAITVDSTENLNSTTTTISLTNTKPVMASESVEITESVKITETAKIAETETFAEPKKTTINKTIQGPSETDMNADMITTVNDKSQKAEMKLSELNNYFTTEKAIKYCLKGRGHGKILKKADSFYDGTAIIQLYINDNSSKDKFLCYTAMKDIRMLNFTAYPNSIITTTKINCCFKTIKIEGIGSIIMKERFKPDKKDMGSFELTIFFDSNESEKIFFKMAIKAAKNVEFNQMSGKIEAECSNLQIKEEY